MVKSLALGLSWPIASTALTSTKLAPVYLSQLYIQIEVKCDLSHPRMFVWHWCEPYLHLCICERVQRPNTSPLAPAFARSLTHTNTHSLRASCLSGGPTEQMDGDAALSLSLRSSASPWGSERKVACARKTEGPRKDGGTLRSIYNKLPASASPMRDALNPAGARACISLYLLLSVWACMYK